MDFRDFLLNSDLKSFENLNEASFSEKNIAKVMQLYSRLFSKNFESKFYLLGEENFRRAGDKGTGARFINEQGHQLRFNWSQKDSKSLKGLNQNNKQLFLSSIDYWTPINSDFAKPTSTLEFHANLNVVQIWDKVSKLLRKGVRGKFTLQDIYGDSGITETSAYAETSVKSEVSEAMYSVKDLNLQQAKAFAKSVGVKGAKYHGMTKKGLEDFLRDNPDLHDTFDEFVFEIKEGKKETNDFEVELEKVEKSLDDKVYSDPDLVFEDIERMVEFIAKKGSKSFICCGLGGIGKCLDSETLVKTSNGNKQIRDITEGDFVVTPEGNLAKVQDVYHQKSKLQMFKITLENNLSVEADLEQLFQVKTNNIEKIVCLKEFLSDFSLVKIPVIIDKDKTFINIKSIEKTDLKDAVCIKIDSKDHLFVLENGIVVHNTFHITKTLERMFGEAGVEWNYHSGLKVSPFSIYKTVFQERKSTIVFDEADDILTNSDIVVQLKPVLDTSGKNTMEYAHGTKSTVGMSEEEIKSYSDFVDSEIANGKPITASASKGVQLPSKFFFEGQMIFISNMRADKIDQAIMSRSLFIDVYLCATDINKRIQSIMKAKHSDMNNDELEEIMEALGQSLPKAASSQVTYMTPELARKNKPVTVRSMELAIRMKKLGIKNWERLASLYV